MTKRKAEVHLKHARTHLNALRDLYVVVVRSNEWKRLNVLSLTGTNIYKERIKDLRLEMEIAKTRIAKFERIVR